MAMTDEYFEQKPSPGSLFHYVRETLTHELKNYLLKIAEKWTVTVDWIAATIRRADVQSESVSAETAQMSISLDEFGEFLLQEKKLLSLEVIDGQPELCSKDLQPQEGAMVELLYDIQKKKIRYKGSSASIKTEIAPVNDNQVLWVFKIPVKQYKLSASGYQEIGLLAEDVGKYCSQLAVSDESGIASYAGAQMIPTLVRALQILNERVSVLEEAYKKKEKEKK